METLEACLPANLRGPATSITRIAAGLSGAGVYRVDADGRSFVLKVSSEPLEDWRRKLHLRQLAANAGLTPRVVHVDAAQRAVLCDFVVDRSFVAFFSDPRTRDAAIAALARTMRRVHELPLPPDAPSSDPRELLAKISSSFAMFAVPPFVHEAARRVLAESPPPSDRPLVLSHNDVNPTNLVYDGERILLLDWDTAGANDPLYDLAAIAVFLRMDDDTCRALLSAYDGTPTLPDRFHYNRRLIAALCGCLFLHIARHNGHVGSTTDAPPTLVEFYQHVRAGTLSPATADGQWQFGLALVTTSLALTAQATG